MHQSPARESVIGAEGAWAKREAARRTRLRHVRQVASVRRDGVSLRRACSGRAGVNAQVGQGRDIAPLGLTLSPFAASV